MYFSRVAPLLSQGVHTSYRVHIPPIPSNTARICSGETNISQRNNTKPSNKLRQKQLLQEAGEQAGPSLKGFLSWVSTSDSSFFPFGSQIGAGGPPRRPEIAASIPSP
ncbi:unnamed protein product [Ectocarpus sp. 12 AP-2014]